MKSYLKHIKIFLSYLATVTVMVACNDYNFKQHVESDYFLISVEELEDMSLMTKKDEVFVEVIPQTVFAYGSNKNFIIAKQHPREWPEPSDKSVEHYYIIPITNPIDNVTEYNRIGPMTKSEFAMKREELGVPSSLTFTMVIDELQ